VGTKYQRVRTSPAAAAEEDDDGCLLTDVDIVLINPPYIPSVQFGHLHKQTYESQEEEDDDEDDEAGDDDDGDDNNAPGAAQEDEQVANEQATGKDQSLIQLQAYGDGGICGEDITSAVLNAQNLAPCLKVTSNEATTIATRNGVVMVCVVANLMDPAKYPSKIRR
jgi:methylase of polypeptide subunit release factors